MLVFVSPGCGPCRQLLPDVAQWQTSRAAEVTVVLITERPRAPGSNGFDGFRNVLFDDRKAVFEAYHIQGTPSAVVIHPTGRTAGAKLIGPEAIRQHMTMTAAEGARRPDIIVKPDPPAEQPRDGTQFVGMPLPDLSLPTGAGELVSTAAFRGTNTVFLFWNPHCGFCQQMEPDILGWERAKTSEAPTLVIVSSAPIGLDSIRATVFLDVDFRFGRACVITGTPSAIATDREGVVLEPVAVGATSILELLRRLERR